MGGLGFYELLITLGFIFLVILPAVLCNRIAKRKNLNVSEWTGMGIFFGVIAFILLLTTPPEQKNWRAR